ncbi:MAG TPA: cytochrome c peroxidase, partial [Planctomycetota bacterium]|nr:cytochrome c peroxidase [Planctomycetota bacterium]
ASLEEQALVPIADPREMGLGVEAALARLKASSEYAPLFQSVYGVAADERTLARSIAAFTGRLYLGDSPVDRFRIDNDFAALSKEERSGLWLYESRGRCWRCHSGPNFSDESFHNTGVGAKEGVAEEGRLAITHEASDRGRFKTPTLRGVALTAPYMHDGSLATLEDVVQFYREGGRANADLAPELAPVEMSDEDAKNLAAFLRALSRQAAR